MLSIDDWQEAVAPSIRKAKAVDIDIAASPPDGVVVGVPVAADGDPPAELPLDRDSMRAAGFTGEIGQTLALPRRDGVTVLVGIGDPARLGVTGLRDAAAALARATTTLDHIAIDLTGIDAPDPAATGRAVVEGALLARYRFDSLRREPSVTALTRLTLVTGDDRRETVGAGAEQGRRTSAATQLARDLANSPPVLLTAARMAELAASIGPDRGLDVEVFDEDALGKLGCGGLLGVNAGSAEPPRMIKLTYVPRDDDGAPVAPTGRLALVGKGIMYDAGGIALKPADEVHATMKNDMSGAGAILAAMLELRDVGCTAAVTAYLMCTDNRPSGTALAMGDVLTTRGGTSVEVVNTDAEGRLVMADALVLATEEPVDAIVDVATLTGAAQRTFGARVAAVMGNDQARSARLWRRRSRARAWADAVEDVRFAPRPDPYVGQVSRVGPALFAYLRMRSGADALKPDVRVHDALEALGWAVPRDAAALLTACEALADDVGMSRLTLDQLLWWSRPGTSETRGVAARRRVRSPMPNIHRPPLRAAPAADRRTVDLTTLMMPRTVR